MAKCFGLGSLSRRQAQDTVEDFLPHLFEGCGPVEHAAGGETSLLMAIRPDLVALDKTFETDRSLRAHYDGEQAHLRRRAESPHKYIGVNTGVADSSNDPEGATVERGRALLEAIVGRVAARAGALLRETTSADER